MEIIQSTLPAQEAGTFLTQKIQEQNSGRVLLLVSGGSALTVLEHCMNVPLGEHIILGLIDERYSLDPEISNYAQFADTNFFKLAMQNGAHVLDQQVREGDSQESVADRWHSALASWRENNPEGKIVALLGMGEDGHTAGIMPGDYDVDFSGERLAVAYTVPKEVNQYTERITVTYIFLEKHVDVAVMYAVSKKKQELLQSIQTGEVDLGIRPAAVINLMKNCTVFTNREE